MNPFVISVFDNAYAPQDWVGAPLELDATVKKNAAAELVFKVDADDEQLVPLLADGARVVVEYRHDPTDPDSPMFLVSGMVQEVKGASGLDGTREFQILDDFAYVMSIKGWPNPTGDINHQGDDSAYYTVTGPAETVVKTLVSVNATRMGIPVTCATDLGRGDTITVSVRNHPLGDRLFPAVDQAGIVVTCRQVGTGIVVDCYEPAVLTDELTEASGVVQSGTFDLTAPTMTRVVVGGAGEGTARTFVQRINTAAEAAFGVVIEGFVDARDATLTATLEDRGDAALAAAAPGATVTASLSETDDFRFGVTVNLGDLVPIALNNAPTVTDEVTACAFAYTADQGLVVTPQVGNALTTFEDLALAAISHLAARTRDQDVRS